MKADGSTPRTRADYLEVLRGAGHKGSPNSAALIVNREAKRAFGKPLPRRQQAGPRLRTHSGRQASPATSMLREKLAEDKAGSGLREATHYVRWLVDKANVGIQKARPVVYRELRALRT